jgi:hypothetical protein
VADSEVVAKGEVQMVKSQTSGRYYATARTCSISCTFNDVICEGLISKSLPGSIEKMDCDPYVYLVQETGEVLTLTHTYYYNPNPRTMEQEVFKTQVLKSVA